MPETTDPRVDPIDLRAGARHVMVDFNQMQNFTANPLIMVEGDGITLTDHEGRRYIDGISGVFAVSLGHGNDEIVEAIVAQHRRLSFSSPIMTTTDRALELAAELIRVTGGRYDIVKQLSSGSEATEAAITNALLAAETTTGANDLRVYAMPVDRMLAAMRKYGRMK